MFKKYSSLTNHYEGKFINAIVENGFNHDSILWVAREKIHGANFSFICNGITVTAAKRSGVIGEVEQFYSSEGVIAKNKPKVLELYSDLIELGVIGGVGDTIQLYGELAGVGVQAGTAHYGEKDFYAFDLLVHLSESKYMYLDDDVMSPLCASNGIKVAPLLGYGTFEQLSKLPNAFSSVVGSMNSHTNMKADGEWKEPVFPTATCDNIDDIINLAEGYVLKPNTAMFIGNDRVSIKCKNSKFSEKSKSDKVIIVPEPLNEKDLNMLNECIRYLNENRLKNVMSKIGTGSDIQPKMFGKITGLLVQDALIDITKEHADFSELFENVGTAKRVFNTTAKDIVREHWGKILNGEF